MPLAIGSIALAVFSTDSVPPLDTSQTQPEPNCSLPAAANFSSSVSSESKSRSMACSRAPDGLDALGLSERQ